MKSPHLIDGSRMTSVLSRPRRFDRDSGALTCRAPATGHEMFQLVLPPSDGTARVDFSLEVVVRPQNFTCPTLLRRALNRCSISASCRATRAGDTADELRVLPSAVVRVRTVDNKQHFGKNDAAMPCAR